MSLTQVKHLKLHPLETLSIWFCFCQDGMLESLTRGTAGSVLYGPLILLSLLNSASLSSIMRRVQGHIPGVRQSQACDTVSWLLAIQGTVRGNGTRQMRKC